MLLPGLGGGFARTRLHHAHTHCDNHRDLSDRDHHRDPRSAYADPEPDSIHFDEHLHRDAHRLSDPDDFSDLLPPANAYLYAFSYLDSLPNSLDYADRHSHAHAVHHALADGYPHTHEYARPADEHDHAFPDQYSINRPVEEDDGHYSVP